MPTLNVLAFSGSLRHGSFNTAALGAARELAPEGMAIAIADISDVPLYNDDVRAEACPAAVARLDRQVRAAGALLFAVTEYNYSMSGVLKNAIDWLSRMPDQPFAGKPAAILGASGGMLGTARAQYHFRQTAVFVDLKLVSRPEVMIAHAAQKFDAEGRLTDEKTRDAIRKLLEALARWTEQLAK
jgi:chromate reductase